MNENADVWQRVQGIDSDGPAVRSNLRELLSGSVKSSEEQWDILCDLYRDGVPSTAAYAAVPLLLDAGLQVPPKLAWGLCLTAGRTLASIGRADSPPVPDCVREITNESTRIVAFERILTTAARAKLSVAELLDTFLVVLELHGRADLRGRLENLILEEYQKNPNESAS